MPLDTFISRILLVANLSDKGTLLKDFQLKLGAVLCLISGTIIGVQQSGTPRYVLLFTSDTKSRERQKIHQFVYSCVQKEIDAL